MRYVEATTAERVDEIVGAVRHILQVRNPFLLSSQMNTRELPISGVEPSMDGASRCRCIGLQEQVKPFTDRQGPF